MAEGVLFTDRNVNVDGQPLPASIGDAVALWQEPGHRRGRVLPNAHGFRVFSGALIFLSCAFAVAQALGLLEGRVVAGALLVALTVPAGLYILLVPRLLPATRDTHVVQRVLVATNAHVRVEHGSFVVVPNKENTLTYGAAAVGLPLLAPIAATTTSAVRHALDPVFGVLVACWPLIQTGVVLLAAVSIQHPPGRQGPPNDRPSDDTARGLLAWLVLLWLVMPVLLVALVAQPLRARCAMLAAGVGLAAVGLHLCFDSAVPSWRVLRALGLGLARAYAELGGCVAQLAVDPPNAALRLITHSFAAYPPLVVAYFLLKATERWHPVVAFTPGERNRLAQPRVFQLYFHPQEHVNSISLLLQRYAVTRPGAEPVLFFVHGYNTPFADALVRAAQLQRDLDVQVVLISWPSHARIHKFFADVAAAQRACDCVYHAFDEFERSALFRTTAFSAHILAHSLGTRILLSVLLDLQKLRRRRQAESGEQAADAFKPLFRHAVFMAPECDHDRLNLNVPGIFDCNVVDTLTLYTNHHDLALMLSSATQCRPCAGNQPALEHPNVDVIRCDETAILFGLNHSPFSLHQVCFDDLLVVPCSQSPFICFLTLPGLSSSAGNVRPASAAPQ